MIMMRSITIFLILITIIVPSFLSAQSANRSYFIGENQEEYHELIQTHSASLLEVCDNSMTKSYEHWSSLMKDIEEFCLQNAFDIKGVKLWINGFWDNDGKLVHLVFYNKPNSKQMNYDKLRILLDQFISNGYYGKEFNNPYAHYGSISFPIFSPASMAVEK